MVTATRPFISFLMTAYRTERYVAEAIQSVLAQTRTDWELIVVDNGNSDEMARIVGGFAEDARITLIRQQNMGIRGGITAAAREATGRYLCVLNSDDLLRPDYCERIGHIIDADPGIDALGCDAVLFTEPDDGTPVSSYFASTGRRSMPDPARPVSLQEFLECGVPVYIGAFRREIWDAHGAFDPAEADVEPDVVLWLRSAAAGADIRVLPDRLARIRLRPNSSSRDPARITEFEERMRRSFLSVTPAHDTPATEAAMVRRLRYSHQMRRAREALAQGDTATARMAVGDAFTQQRTVRAAAVIGILRVSPRLLRAVHPAKNRMQNAVARRRAHLHSEVPR